MSADRWRDIERLYHEAASRTSDDRAAFLREACGDDQSLHREVESLLACRDNVNEFLDVPPLPGALAGTMLGPYAIEALIASGGMGEVYRATDTRLERTVAVKCLPAALLQDRARRERFEREARIASRLSHPHICALYDVGVHGAVPYLVMEFLDGETLGERLARGPMPWRLACEYLTQVADALGAAHRMGLVHRDLKPGNVMLSTSGVKLLDFGAAAWLLSDGGDVGDARRAAADRLTTGGTLIGTLSYMAPEQLKGEDVDARTDIFALGLLAHEMLTGARPFARQSPLDEVAAVLKDDPPPLAALMPDAHPSLGPAVARCLAKDRNERWQDANDLAFQLRSIAHAHDAPPPARRRRGLSSRHTERAAWALVATASLVAALYLWARPPTSAPAAPSARRIPVRVSLQPPPGTAFASGFDVPFSLSPDGRHLAYVTTAADDTNALWLYSFESGQHRILPGTEGANTPFWAPDGEWLGFFSGLSLKRVRISTGLTQVIATGVYTWAGATWSTTDTILFSVGPAGLRRVSANGGPVSAITLPETGQFWPQFLSDGTHYLYIAARRQALEIGSLDGAPPRTLTTFPVRLSALAYVPGFVFFVRDAQLLVQRFDEGRLATVGEPVRLIDGIPVTGAGRAPFAVSAAGLLAYWPYAQGTPARLRWFERDGRASTLVETPAKYMGFDVSPDGRSLAMSRIAETGGVDLWVRDLTTHREARVTFDGAAYAPRWSPDGARILFSGAGQSPPPKTFIAQIGAQATAVLVSESPVPTFGASWDPARDAIVTVRIDPTHGNDLWWHRLGDARQERLWFNGPANESHGQVSPDGRWIAYVSDESGRAEVCVASFPDTGMRHQVSADGGSMPAWTRNGTELAFVTPDKRLRIASFAPAAHGNPEIGAPRDLFALPDLVDLQSVAFPTTSEYAAQRDGTRFLAAIRAQDPDAPPIQIVVDWAALLGR